MSVSAFPCHSQAIKWHIKPIIKASGILHGQEARDAFIRTQDLKISKNK